jgi:S1-C subfamily serine protease
MISLNDLIERVSQSVVTIVSRPFSINDYVQGRTIQGGSGFFVSKNYVATNMHVVEGADEVQILTKDSLTIKGKVVHVNPITDLALVETNIEVPSLPKGNNVRIGDFVIVLGSPFLFDLGDLTVSFGIVSSTNREIKSPYGYNMIVHQTDAAVNPGNSGGPVINMDGQVVGIAQSHLEKSENINFMVPMISLNSFIANVSKNGRYVAPYTGIERVRVVNKTIAKMFSLPVERGLMIQRISPGSPAERAGLTVGDVILYANGAETPSTLSLWEVSERVAPGVLNLIVLRDGRKYAARLEVEGRKIEHQGHLE